MKQLYNHFLTLAAAAALLGGCSKTEPAESGQQALRAQIAIAGAASASVQTRAMTDLRAIIPDLVVPETGDLHLTLSGDDIARLETDYDGNFIEVSRFDYAGQWERLAEYEANRPALFPGVYAARLSYGDPAATGPNAPYYEGNGSVELTRADVGREVRCAVQVAVANAVVRVEADEAFRSYFFDPSFRLIVDGEPTDYTFAATADDAPIFVPAGAEVALQGTVCRPSQTADGKGEVLLVEVPARTVSGGTLATFRFSAQAGGVEVSVTFLAPEPGSDDDFEMNDDAKED